MAGFFDTRRIDLNTMRLVPAASDASVPGATAGAPDEAVDLETEALAADILNSDTQKLNKAADSTVADAQEKITDQLDLLEEAKKAKLDAEKAQIEAEKASLDAAGKVDAISGGEYVPAEAAQGTVAVSAEAAPTAEAPEAAQPSLYDQAVEGVTEVAQADTISASAKNDAELQRAENAMLQAAQISRDLDAEDRLRQQQIAENEKMRSDIRAKQQELFNKDIKPPSPSVANLIGVFLGGLMAPMQGGRNVALETVQKQIQQEVDTELQNRSQKLQQLGMQVGDIDRSEAAQERQAAARTVLLARKYNAVDAMLEARIASNLLPQENIANLKRIQGELKKTVADLGVQFQDRFIAQVEKQQQFELNALRAQMAANKGKGGGGSGGGKAKSGASAIAGPSTYYNTFTGHGVSGSDVDKEKDTRERAVRGGLEITDAAGVKHRGFLARTKQEADEAQKQINGFQNVRQRVQRIRTLMDQVEGFDRLKWGALQATPEGGELASEFTQMMVSLKDLWGLGAIQKPDMFLLENSMGNNPTEISAWLGEKFTGTDIRRVLENFQSGGAEQLKNSLLRMADLSKAGNVEVFVPEVATDIKDRNRKQAAETTPQLISQVENLVGKANPLSYSDLSTGDIVREIRDRVTQIETRGKASTGVESGKTKTGGKGLTGGELQRFRDLREQAVSSEAEPAVIAELDRAIDVLSQTQGVRDQTAKEQVADARENVRRDFFADPPASVKKQLRNPVGEFAADAEKHNERVLRAAFDRYMKSKEGKSAFSKERKDIRQRRYRVVK